MGYFPLLGAGIGVWAAAIFDAAASLWPPLVAAAISSGGTLWLTAMFVLIFSNFWLFFGKLCEARSRLYLRRFLQKKILNTRLKALDEIYKIYTLLHRSAFKNSAKFRQCVFAFSQFSFQIVTDFSKKLSKIHKCW